MLDGDATTDLAIFGRAMADLLAGGREEGLQLPISDVQTVPSTPIMSRYYQITFATNQLWKSFQQKSKRICTPAMSPWSTPARAFRNSMNGMM